MTHEEFYSNKADIIKFCERNCLNHEWGENEHELDFVIDYGMESVDLRTLENPTCINVDAFIIVHLPAVVDCSNDKPQYTTSREHYQNVAYGLMETCRPDYIMGVKDGIVSAVCYAVWSDQQKKSYNEYLEGIDEMVAKAGGYLLLKKEFQPLVLLSDGCNQAKETKIKSILRVVESETECNGLVTEVCSQLKVIDWEDEMWDLCDYTDTENICKVYCACKANMNK